MKIIDLGGAFYVLDQIAYMTKCKDEATNAPIIKIFLKGNPASFCVSFESEVRRDEVYSEWKNRVINYEI